MDSNYRPYNHVSSFGRIRDILNQADLSYQEVQNLPDRDQLTYTNGFYAYCSALFVDIRGSSQLPSRYRRPTLARLYRAYVSEVVAIMNGQPRCREVNIVGDGAWAVYNTPSKTDIDAVFAAAFQINSMMKVLNYELGRRSIEPIRVGIGMSYGRGLMIKAGYSGSGINDVVYMGDVVNEAAKLAAHGSEGPFDKPLMISELFYKNLNEMNRSFLSYIGHRRCWHGNVVDSRMDEWFQQNCT